MRMSPVLPSRPIAMPSIPFPPKTLLMSEKSTANVSPSRPVSGMFPSSHSPAPAAKSYRDSHPDTRSCARFQSAREPSLRRGPDRSLTSVDRPATTSGNSVVSAVHSGLCRSP